MSQGNPLKGEAFAVIDGDEFHFVLNNHTLIGIESVLGESALDVVHRMKAKIEAGHSPLLKHACAVAYGCLFRQHPEVTEDWVVENILDPALMKALLDVFKGADIPDLPDDEPEQVGNGAKPTAKRKAGTGKRSSAPGAKPASSRTASGGKRRGR